MHYQNSKIKKLIFISFILCFIISGCAKQGIRNLSSTGKNIICFGDSITEGAGILAEEAFPSILRKSLDFPVINAGKGRDTTFGALSRIKRDVLEKEPLVVIVEFGGNDFLQKITFKDTLKNIDEIVKRIQEQGAIVVLLDVKASFFMNRYSSGYRKIALKRGAIFILGILSEVLSNPSLKSDYLHPNSEGHKIISQKILKVLLPVIEENRRLKVRK